MTSRQLDHLDATAQAQLLRDGEVTNLELFDAAIARIKERDTEVHAIAGHNWESARSRASEPLDGSLAGVPFLVKDLIPYPGLRYSLGCRLFAAGVPALPSPYSEALDAAGLIVLGKSTTSELGLLGSTETVLEGITHNPWRSGISAGGSSGGAAAAVASGMVPMAHASDGGGSIRIPASLNGLFGFKPSSRRIVTAGIEDMDGLVAEHCVSWSVRDSALLLSLTEQADGTNGRPAVGYIQGPETKRLRIGYYHRTLMGDEPTADVMAALGDTVTLCRELGHEVIEVDGPDVDGRAVSDGFFTIAGSGIAKLATMMQPILGRELGSDDLEPFTLAMLHWYRGLDEATIAETATKRDRAGVMMNEFINGFDVVLCPTIPDQPHEIGWLSPELDRELLLERTERLAGYTAIHNIAGVPAMSVPLSVSPGGLPLGSHFAAPVGREAILLGLAYELEEARPWKSRLPFFR